MVVVRLHQTEHFVVLADAVAEVLAVVPLLQLDDPDTLAGRPTVLLDHARLVSHGLLEAGLEPLAYSGVGRCALRNPKYQMRSLLSS